MKRILTLFFIIFGIIILSGCWNENVFSKITNREGVEPYKLSQKEEQLLEYFGLENDYQIVSFNAPEEAITLKINIYSLKDGSWESTDEGGISIGKERELTKKLSGTFAMLKKDNYSFDFNITCSGRASYKTKEIIRDSNYAASTWDFLSSHQKIELNKEIPIAVYAYTDATTFHSIYLQDYFEPSRFEGMDLVQVVTLTFSDKEL